MGEKFYPKQARRVSGWVSAVLVFAEMFTQMVPASGEPRFYPSGCGGHKNLENTATFSKFLGREEKPRLRAPFLLTLSPSGDGIALPER